MEIRDDQGNLVPLDLTELNISTPQGDLTPTQREALESLLSAGRLDNLDTRRADLLRDVRARLGEGKIPGLQDGLIVRFDLTWVRID